MHKVLSARELSDLLAEQANAASLEAVVTPTADDLLSITEAALGDVDDTLTFSAETKSALRAALRRRLTGLLGGFEPLDDGDVRR